MNPTIDELADRLRSDLVAARSPARRAAAVADYLRQHCRQPVHLAAARLVLRDGDDETFALACVDDDLLALLWTATRCADPARWAAAEADRIRSDDPNCTMMVDPAELPTHLLLPHLEIDIGDPNLGLDPREVPPDFSGRPDLVLHLLPRFVRDTLEELAEDARAPGVGCWQIIMGCLTPPAWRLADARRIARAAAALAKHAADLEPLSAPGSTADSYSRREMPAVDAALALLRRNPDWSMRRIAREAGCDHSFLSRDAAFRTAWEATRKIYQSSRTRNFRRPDGSAVD